MTEKYRKKMLAFLDGCLGTMLGFDRNVMVIEQNNPSLGKVYNSLKIYKDNPDNPNITYHTGLSDESYKILYNNIADWSIDIYSIEVVKEDTSIRIQFNSENFSREAISIDIQNLKQEVEKESLLTFDEDISRDIDCTGLKVLPGQEIKGEMRRTMIDYSEAEAEKIIKGFIKPCLENMTDPDWEPDVIILPQKRNGLGYIFNDLDCAKRHSINEPNVSSYLHDINTDTVYKILFNNMGQWVQSIPEIKVCYLKDGNLRIRFAENASKLDRTLATQRLEQIIKQNVTIGTVNAPLPVIYDKHKEKKGEMKRMNDFSLTNLKDALVNKITHLDKKTVTILALIALVLLVVGKYQDIKDILIGIKDKVKRSKNFKAMVADGTAAIDSLKKIVGVKDSKKDTTNEA